FRGELYRDFADPVGMASRALVEGLFGLEPDLISKTVRVSPGWPGKWTYAEFESPDFSLQFRQTGKLDRYELSSRFPQEVSFRLRLRARFDRPKAVRVNGRPVSWKLLTEAVGTPQMEIVTPPGERSRIEVEWTGNSPECPELPAFLARGEALSLQLKEARLLEVYDPQQILAEMVYTEKMLHALLQGEKGWRTFFVRLKQEDLIWWQPLSFELREPLELIAPDEQKPGELQFCIRNNQTRSLKGELQVGSFRKNVELAPRSDSRITDVPCGALVPGSNRISLSENGKTILEGKAVNWKLSSGNQVCFEPQLLESYFNDRVNRIFEKQYYSPRSPYPTLSIPVQGIGDWCSFREEAEIDDTGLRETSGKGNRIVSPQGIPFAVSSEEKSNVLFSSKWNNYPDSVSLPLSGKASHLYLLMAGSAHHMQSRMVNGRITVNYADGSSDRLDLVSPDNWWPLEQDYYEDGLAFRVDAPRPPRLWLKTGEWHMQSYPVLGRNRTNRIDGGAASLLDLPLDPDRKLRSLSLETRTNDVVIGLMAVTLQR
ncbi:MAG: hypothetical protein AB7D05_03035, partial [Mangrovibacterium sp.]